MICSNQIKKCPVTVQDVEVAQKVWRKNIAALKGKTTRKNPNVVARDQVKIPVGLIKLHEEVILTCDILFVNKIPFFLTLSQKIYFTEVNNLANCTVTEIFKAFKEVYQYYLHCGFRITILHVDGKFGPLKSLIKSLQVGALINLATSNEHVSNIESQIRVVKERCRATCHGLPFQQILKLLTTHIIVNMVKMIRLFLKKGVI